MTNTEILIHIISALQNIVSFDQKLYDLGIDTSESLLCDAREHLINCVLEMLQYDRHNLIVDKTIMDTLTNAALTEEQMFNQIVVFMPKE
jgi:hypothetical protein